MTTAHYKPAGGIAPACRPGDPVPARVTLWPVTGVPQDVTCKTCRRTPAWKEAAGAVDLGEHGTVRGCTAVFRPPGLWLDSPEGLAAIAAAGGGKRS